MNRIKLTAIVLLITPGILYVLAWGYLVAPLFPTQRHVRDRLFQLLKQCFLTRALPRDARDERLVRDALSLVVHSSFITWIAALVFSL